MPSLLPPAPSDAGERRPEHRSRRTPPASIGRRGEDLAAEHMLRLGFEIVARNVRTRAGEIDLVAFDEATLVFAEVKTRVGDRRARALGDAGPLERLGRSQRARLRGLARAWLAAHRGGRPYAAEIRFDAIGVVLDRRGRLLRLDHVEGAW